MKIALHTDLFRKYPIEEVIPLVAQTGYEYIELNAIPYWSPHINFFNIDEGKKESLKKLLDEYHISIAAIGTNTDLAVLEKAERIRNVKYCIEAVKMGSELGCHLVCSTFSGNALLSGGKQKQALGESLRELSNIGLEYGVDIAIELHPGSFIDSTVKAVNLLKSLNLPNVGYLFCCPHIATFAGEELEQALKISRDCIIHFHVADTPIWACDHRHMMPQSGEINFDRLIPQIKQIGYDRFLTIEIYSEDEHPIESAVKSKKIIEGLLGQA